MSRQYIEFDHCTFCEKVESKLNIMAHEMCGPYEDKAYWISSRMDELVEKLFEPHDEPNLKPKRK